MYINIPGGFELVPLNRQRLDRLREATKKLEEMLADNEITAPANDMIVTLYVPRGAMPGPIIARIAARDIPGANKSVQFSRLERQGVTRVPHYKIEKGTRRLYVDLYKTIELND